MNAIDLPAFLRDCVVVETRYGLRERTGVCPVSRKCRCVKKSTASRTQPAMREPPTEAAAVTLRVTERAQGKRVAR